MIKLTRTLPPQPNDSLQERVVVVQAHADEKSWSLRVRPESCINCQTCSDGGGCRANNLFRLFGSRDKTFPLYLPRSESAHKHYEPGNKLALVFHPHALLVSSLFMYCVPLITLLLLTLLGSLFSFTPLTMTLFVLGGGVGIYYLVHQIKRRTLEDKILQPKVIFLSNT